MYTVYTLVVVEVDWYYTAPSPLVKHSEVKLTTLIETIFDIIKVRSRTGQGTEKKIPIT